jgi:hypothetical protein
MGDKSPKNNAKKVSQKSTAKPAREAPPAGTVKR